MIGCPVNAYTKDPVTGIVLHSAERCIGCQYCTWNCSYGVPQYNPERGVVGKCDMCHGRLAEGREPACVNACPEEAIRIEIVDIAAWRREYAAQANAPGLPSADDSISTTRITLDPHLPRDMDRVDLARIVPEQPHWTLILMTVLTQMAVGAVAAMFATQWIGGSSIARLPAAGVVLVALLALGASTLHLGRPLYAFRALSMWRRSWLSREVLFFSLFSGAAIAYAALLWVDARSSLVAGAASAALGSAAIYASARLYKVAARPAWNSLHTPGEFFLTAFFTGPLLASLLVSQAQHPLTHAASAAAGLMVAQQTLKFLGLRRAPAFELRASGELLASRLFRLFSLRTALLTSVACALAFGGARFSMRVACLALALATEVLGRYLFFVSVVPKNMAAPYMTQRRAA